MEHVGGRSPNLYPCFFSIAGLTVTIKQRQNDPVKKLKVGKGKQGGVTLVELLIAMTLGLFLIAGVVEVLIISRVSYSNQDALSELQENSRFAMDFITRDLRAAGYAGCSQVGTYDINTTVSNYNYSRKEAIQGYENTGGAAWDPSVLPATGGSITGLAGDSDVVSIRSAGQCGAVLTADTSPGTSSMSLDNTCGFDSGDVVMIADCENVDIFQVTSASTTTVGHPPLNNTYRISTGGELRSFVYNSYYIANDNGTPSLYLRDNLTGTANALVPGVENLQVEFGVAAGSDGLPNSYKTAKEVSDNNEWDWVVAVRLTLLMRTVENVGAPEYEFQTVEPAYPEGPLRKEFTSVIQLRNLRM
ncbi:MAG: type IV pilus assembly protein PilW [Lentisphaeria bacterium]|jgi:type IV pilus assembly protein PilW